MDATIGPMDTIVFTNNDTLKLVREADDTDDTDQTEDTSEVEVTVGHINGLSVEVEPPNTEALPFLTMDGPHQFCYNRGQNRTNSARIHFNNIIGSAGQALKLHWNVSVVRVYNQSNHTDEHMSMMTDMLVDLLPDNVQVNSFFEFTDKWVRIRNY